MSNPSDPGRPADNRFSKKLASFVSTDRGRALAAVTLFAFLAIATFAYPSYSTENIQLPDLTGLKPFSAEANYMSLEGFVATYCRMNYGLDISRGEARKLVKENLRRHRAASRGEKLSKETVFEVMHREAPTRKAAEAKPEAAAPAAPHAVERFDREAEVKKIYEKYSSGAKGVSVTAPARHDYKKVVLLPFRNVSKNAKAPVPTVMHYAEEYFKNRGYEVINIIADNPNVDFREISDEKMLEMAKKYDAEYIVEGKIQSFGRYKKFRLPGFIVNMVFTSVHSYSDVKLSSRIYSASKNAYIYNSDAYEHKKHQVLAPFHGYKGVVTHAVNDAVKKLYDGFVVIK